MRPWLLTFNEGENFLKFENPRVYMNQDIYENISTIGMHIYKNMARQLRNCYQLLRYV